MDSDDAIQIAIDSLDIVSQVYEVGSDIAAVSKIIPVLGPALGVVGAILSLVGNFLPDSKHEEILSHFRRLSYQIDLVRDDIRNLGNEIGWELTEHHYRPAVNHILLGMKYSVDVGRESGQNGTRVARKRLQNHCLGSACTLHLDNLLKGIIGNGLLTSGSILDKFDAGTAKGHRNRIASLATRLLKVASGGIMVIATYETMMHGEEEAKHFIEQHRFASQLENASRKAQSVLDRCVTNFRQNMLIDLNMFLDAGRSNKDLVGGISNFMSDKYDWLENFVLVYNDLHGSHKHCISGDRVSSLHRNEKCGVVFYRKKGESPRFSGDEDYVKTINNAEKNDAQWNCKNIVSKLRKKRIGWSGLAVIKQNSDLWFTGNVSTKAVSDVGKYATTIILLK